MVISEIHSLYRDENKALRTVIKRIWEERDIDEGLWRVDRVEIFYRDNYAKPNQTLEYRHGWIIPPEWEFVSEVWEYTRQDIRELPRGHTYDHDSEGELLDGEAPIIRES